MSTLPIPPAIVVARLLAEHGDRMTARRRKSILLANCGQAVMARAAHRLPADGGAR
jgi:hypothetical protein